MTNLEECPFCSTDDSLNVTEHGVQCTRCHFTGPLLDAATPIEAAMRGWNERNYHYGVLVRGGIADCPYCGEGNPKLIQYQYGGRAFQCTSCRATGPMVDSKNSGGPPEFLEQLAAQLWTYRDKKHAEKEKGHD